MADKWIVLKFGGTSVAGRSQWEVIAGLAQARRSQGFRVLLVCSAAAGVTNRLTALADQPQSSRLLDELLEIHLELSRDLDVDESDWLPKAVELLDQRLAGLAADAGPQARAALLSVGEWLSTQIALRFLETRMEVSWVDARDALEVVSDPELSPARQWLSAGCSAGRDPELEQRWSELKPVVITQGFIGRTRDGGTALLGRGGSDTSAALLAGRLGAERLEIWTDVPGLFSADPRRIPQARLLTGVNYEEALEMAASGARVVHPRSIRAAGATGTPLVIRDLSRREAGGTRISTGQFAARGIKTITCQEHMAVMLLQNLDARQQVGFLPGVFDVIRRCRVSIDLVATSETTTTVALNRESNHLGDRELHSLAEDLKSLCRVELFNDCVCVNLVGHGASTALCRLQNVMRHFEEHPLLMLSQSANDLCLSLLVRAGDEEPLLHGAHRALIPGPDEPADGVFGPIWEDIRGAS